MSRKFVVLGALMAVCTTLACRAQGRTDAHQLPPGPMLDGGAVTMETPQLSISILRYSGTVSRLSPSIAPGFDYTPGDRLKQRSADTFYHLGDLDLRFRAAGSQEWTDVSSAFHREPVKVLESDRIHFVSDLTNSLTAGSPLRVVRTWAVENGELVLRFKLTNTSAQAVEIGGAGMALVFNNILEGRSLDEAYRTCSFYDPYIGEDAGYVQVSALNGHGPVLLVIPDGHTSFEAWKPILDRRDASTGKGQFGSDPTPRGSTFEGSFEWMVHSAGYWADEWKNAEEWNPATSATIKPGQSLTFGVRFIVAPELRKIESTLAEHGRPVAVGIPGYVVPQDIEAKLFLRYASAVQSIASEPAEAVSISDSGNTVSGLHAYTLRGRRWGRARLVIRYRDGTVQSIAYRVIKPERQAVADMGHFLFHEQWFTDSSDPFHRAPAAITYDNGAGKPVTQDSRVWIAGLSDEAGAGSWLAAAMKEYVEPRPEEVAKLESFVDGVLWGRLQETSGEGKFGVHKSLFFYEPDAVPGFRYDTALNWKSWASWNRKGAEDLGRSYNYPHVVAAYVSLYRIARNTSGLATRHGWEWYLNQAYETALAMDRLAPYYAKYGQMEGTIFLDLLADLKAEAWTDKAAQLESDMRARADHWKAEPYPFGSEMPWDSTGQEEVYGWSRYFGYEDKADVTLSAILAYTPVLPSWGYNGSARRYWDFLYAGKLPRIERQLHHYGSGLNAIPLLDAYREHPDDLYLLRAGYGGVMGPLSNIDEKGFASEAFHSFPDKMVFDDYSGDYGPNFLGHALNTATYLVHDPAYGWICFGGNVREEHGIVHVTVLDSARNRLFVAPIKLWITLDAGRMASADFNIATHQVELHVEPATEHVVAARLRLQQSSEIGEASGKGQPSSWKLTKAVPKDAGAYRIDLGAGETTVTIQPHEQ